MKIYIIKHKGKNWLGNMEMSHTVEIGKNKFYAQLCFYRKKDALAYLNSKKYSEFFEVTSAELKQSKQDNRLNNK